MVNTLELRHATERMDESLISGGLIEAGVGEVSLLTVLILIHVRGNRIA